MQPTSSLFGGHLDPHHARDSYLFLAYLRTTSFRLPTTWSRYERTLAQADADAFLAYNRRRPQSTSRSRGRREARGKNNCPAFSPSRQSEDLLFDGSEPVERALRFDAAVADGLFVLVD